MTTLTARRKTLEGKLAELKAARGSALLDGRKFDNSAVAAAEQELAAIVEAEGEAGRRARALASETEAERLSRLTAQEKGELVQLIAQAGLAEQAARDLRTRFKAILGHATTIAAARSAAGKKPLTALQANEVARRFSERLSLQLMSITHPSTFGSIKLHTGARLTHGADAAVAASWTDEEKRLLGDDKETA